MLVITRREGEEIVIGDPSNPIGTVRLVSIKGDRVRIGLEFSRDIQVHRKEVAEHILSEGAGKVGAQAVETCRGRTLETTDRSPSSGIRQNPPAQPPSASDSQPSGRARPIPTTQVERGPWDRNPRR